MAHPRWKMASPKYKRPGQTVKAAGSAHTMSGGLKHKNDPESGTLTDDQDPSTRTPTNRSSLRRSGIPRRDAPLIAGVRAGGRRGPGVGPGRAIVTRM